MALLDFLMFFFNSHHHIALYVTAWRFHFPHPSNCDRIYSSAQHNTNQGDGAVMHRYIALLRGINISGKNKVPMETLKKGCEMLGLTAVVTHLQSGNVIFSSDEPDASILSHVLSVMIEREFGICIPVLILLQSSLVEVLSNAPSWWGSEDKAIYDNLIFLMPPLTCNAFYQAIGDPKTEYEQAAPYKDVIFWSFSRKDYQKTSWWSKTATASIKDAITIRTAGTVRKIATL